MVDQYGAGVYLDQQLDFEIDPTGDTRTSSGIDELEKDLAVQMKLFLSFYLGEPPTAGLESDVADTARKIANADPRVTTVARGSTNVSFSETRDELTVEMRVRVGAGEQQLVFEI